MRSRFDSRISTRELPVAIASPQDLGRGEGIAGALALTLLNSATNRRPPRGPVRAHDRVVYQPLRCTAIRDGGMQSPFCVGAVLRTGGMDTTGGTPITGRPNGYNGRLVVRHQVGGASPQLCLPPVDLLSEAVYAPAGICRVPDPSRRLPGHRLFAPVRLCAGAPRRGRAWPEAGRRSVGAVLRIPSVEHVNMWLIG